MLFLIFSVISNIQCYSLSNTSNALKKWMVITGWWLTLKELKELCFFIERIILVICCLLKRCFGMSLSINLIISLVLNRQALIIVINCIRKCLYNIFCTAIIIFTRNFRSSKIRPVQYWTGHILFYLIQFSGKSSLCQ